jgi:ribosomal protein S18 acetylase RimI-like enzyme
VLIEQATWRDLSAFISLEKACFGRDAWPWIDCLAALTFPEIVRLKAVSEDRPIGFVIGDRRRRESLGWIASIGVHPDFRRQGIGRSLLIACEQQLGMPRMRLTLRNSNEAAKSLYRHCGYIEVDVWSRYYADGEDGIVMEKNVGARGTLERI